MLRYLQKPDIPFSREDATRYLPWVVAVMVCLVGLLATAGISLHQASSASGKVEMRAFQVYVPHGKTSLTGELVAQLRARPEVDTAQVLTPEAMQELIEPWTSGNIEMKELPLPNVIEVTLKSEGAREGQIAALTEWLQSRDSAIEVESYQHWVDKLTDFTKTLRLGVFVLVFLVVAALMALVFVVVRTSLMLHFHVVRLLHHLGARDDYIIDQFMTNGCLIVLKGSAMGMGLASVFAVALSTLSSQQASPIMPEIALSWLHVLVLIALPLIMVGGAALLVRLTMKQLLEQLH